MDINNLVKWPFKQFSNGDGLNMIIWMGILFLIVWILTSYGVIPSCPKIGKKDKKIADERAVQVE